MCSKCRYSSVCLVVWFVLSISVCLAAEPETAPLPSGVLEQGRTVVLDDIVFDFDQASLKPEYNEILEWLALYLVQNPDRKVIISGHTDSTGPNAYNTYLSKKRAHAVSEVLSGAGIARERIMLRWFGEGKLLGDNAVLSNRVKSRRVEIEIQ